MCSAVQVSKGDEVVFAILVIDNSGEENYLRDGMGDTPTFFSSRRRAQAQVDFMKIGMEGDVQSINIVPYPKRKRPE